MARILLVDDESTIRRTLGRYLRRRGHQVVEAESGVEALRLVATESPDLVITDINMPDVDGIEIITTLSETSPGIPIIAISGGGWVSRDALLTDADLLGATWTLGKPFDLDELGSLVDQALASE